MVQSSSVLHKTLLLFGLNSCRIAVDSTSGDGRRRNQSKRERNGGYAVNRCGESSTALVGDAAGLQRPPSPYRVTVMRAEVKLRCAHHDPQRVGCKPPSQNATDRPTPLIDLTLRTIVSTARLASITGMN